MTLPVFDHPLLPAPSQDPWVTFFNGQYLALNTDGQRFFLRRSPEVFQLFRQSPATIWRARRTGKCSKHLWAPELHRFNARWFIYYAADDGRNRNHRLWALESVGDDPGGPYRDRGMIETGGWSIDATVLRAQDDQNFLLWSGWAGQEKGPQNLYIAPLGDPLTLASGRVLLAEPDQPWEQGGSPILEGPAVLQRGNTTCVVYSAGASWTTHACLGMLVHQAGSYLDAASWTKAGVVLGKTRQVWGIGHGSLVDTADGQFIFYHAKTRRTRGWKDRNIRAQTFVWGEDGLPFFGVPAPGLVSPPVVSSVRRRKPFRSLPDGWSRIGCHRASENDTGTAPAPTL